MELEILGSGTSFGVPEIGCDCEVCESPDPRDQRYRCSVWLRHEELSLVVDAPPEFRLQCRRAGLTRLDAMLITHLHADHIFGLDDLRKFNRLQEAEMPVYLPETMEERFRQLFHYTLESAHSGLTRPRFDLRAIGLDAFTLGEVRIQPLDMEHSHERIYGYLFQVNDFRIAYMTDCKSLSAESEALVRGADVAIIGALWKADWTHAGHLNLQEAIAYSQKLGIQRTLLTHITHKMGLHAATSTELPTGIELAYDGLVIRDS